MTRFQVHARNAAGTAGTGNTILEAADEDAARAVFAANEGMTVEQFAAAGLTIYVKEI